MNGPKPLDSEQPKTGKTIFVNLRAEEPYSPTEEETRFFRQKYKPPFVEFVSSGRRVASSLTPLQSVALAFAFPAFAGRATIDREGAAEPDWAKDLRNSPTYDENVERQLQMRGSFRRRYSADTDNPLPREKYFALASEAAKERCYTLLGELNAYALPLKSGCCAAVPLAGQAAVGAVFRGLPGEPNPLYRFVTEPGRYSYLFDSVRRDPRSLISPDLIASVPSDTEFTVAVPCEDVDISIERAFDMRLQTTRQWMVDFFRNPPEITTNDDLAHGGWLHLMAGQYKFDLSRVDSWRACCPS